MTASSSSSSRKRAPPRSRRRSLASVSAREAFSTAACRRMSAILRCATLSDASVAASLVAAPRRNRVAPSFSTACCASAMALGATRPVSTMSTDTRRPTGISGRSDVGGAGFRALRTADWPKKDARRDDLRERAWGADVSMPPVVVSSGTLIAKTSGDIVEFPNADGLFSKVHDPRRIAAVGGDCDGSSSTAGIPMSAMNEGTSGAVASDPSCGDNTVPPSDFRRTPGKPTPAAAAPVTLERLRDRRRGSAANTGFAFGSSPPRVPAKSTASTGGSGLSSARPHRSQRGAWSSTFSASPSCRTTAAASSASVGTSRTAASECMCGYVQRLGSELSGSWKTLASSTIAKECNERTTTVFSFARVSRRKSSASSLSCASRLFFFSCSCCCCCLRRWPPAWYRAFRAPPAAVANRPTSGLPGTAETPCSRGATIIERQPKKPRLACAATASPLVSTSFACGVGSDGSRPDCVFGVCAEAGLLASSASISATKEPWLCGDDELSSRGASRAAMLANLARARISADVKLTSASGGACDAPALTPSSTSKDTPVDPPAWALKLGIGCETFITDVLPCANAAVESAAFAPGDTERDCSSATSSIRSSALDRPRVQSGLSNGAASAPPACDRCSLTACVIVMCFSSSAVSDGGPNRRGGTRSTTLRSAGV
mmetsp:Transcript_35020/g.108073  ORF Transcript_35020/g.108073 Transcript_35020/m.108073 type:complete len:662 (+) Transcript_35020:556-2541(+)